MTSLLSRVAVVLTMTVVAFGPVTPYATAAPTRTGPTVSLKAGPVDALSQLTLTFSEPVTGLSASSVTLVERDSGKQLTADVWCPMPDSVGFQQDCVSANAPTTKAWVVVRDSVLAGQYFVLKLASSIVDATGQSVTPQVFPLRGLTSLTAFNLDQSWQTVSAAGTVSGGYRRSDEAGASMFTVATDDQTAELHVLQGPHEGIATVTWLNKKHTIDLYAPTPSERTVTLAGQGSAPCSGFVCIPAVQTVTIDVTGRKDARSAGRWVSVDALTVNGSPASLRQLWPERLVGSSTLFYSAVKGASATRTFRGSSLTWLTWKGPDQGIAALYVDGKRRATLDDYAATAHRDSYRLSFPDGIHTFKVVNLGQRDRRSTGTQLTLVGLRLG